MIDLSEMTRQELIDHFLVSLMVKFDNGRQVGYNDGYNEAIDLCIEAVEQIKNDHNTCRCSNIDKVLLALAAVGDG